MVGKFKSRKPKPKSHESNILKILKIIVWPFKIIYICISWIIKGLVLFIGWIIGMSEKKQPEKQPSLFVPFKVIETINGHYSGFESFVEKNPRIILGARGSGKSAIGLKLLENLHANTKKKFYAMGLKDLPEWIINVENLETITNNSYILIDEGGILFSARQSFSDANKLLSQLLMIARHKDLSVIFISQNSANLEINAIRQADYLIMKPSSLLQKDFERKKIKEIYEDAAGSFLKHSRVKGLAYIYSDQFKGFVSNALPTFWTAKISKSFSNRPNK
jgi:hypothetical protein